ncbi:MAG: hypothetical protein PUB89_15005 [Oscillospiraceae bacterium]|nr:hypothetical protein [Oscillospiraceae bacterium]
MEFKKGRIIIFNIVNKHPENRTLKIAWLVILLFVIISNVQWFVEKDVTDFSLFIKGIAVTNQTYGSILFCWLFPLAAGLPVLDVKPVFANNSNKECLKYLFSSAVIGGAIPFCAIIIDFMLLSSCYSTYMPVPNDMITGYHSGMIFSEMFFTYPRLFIIIWAFICFLWGALFASLMCMIYFIFKNRIITIIVFGVIYGGNVFIHNFFSMIPAWRNLFYAESYDNCCENYLVGFIMLISINVLLLLIYNFQRNIRSNDET